MVFSRKELLKFSVILLALLGASAVALSATLPYESACIMLPVLTATTIFLLFAMILKWQIGDNLFGELGFLYLALILIYTVMPAFAFMVVDLNLASGWVSAKLAPLLPVPSELGIHLWRHVLFLFGVGTGYLLVRGVRISQPIVDKNKYEKDHSTIVVLCIMAAICILCVSLLSAPVDTYIDNYTRYDHLSWLPRKFVSLCVRLKTGIYAILMVFLFRNYQKYKLIIPVIVAVICIHEMVYSFGARIDSLIILLIVFCLYNYKVKTVTVKKGLMTCLALGVLFTAVETYRSSGFSLSTAKNTLSDEGVKPASELGAVYFTGFHLYAERSRGTVPPKEWPMFFFDFISPIIFNDFTRWNPQYWYARYYFPHAIVPPETMGPIADSAIWGGEIDLILRSLINGVFFASLVRWFMRNKDKWWAVAIYVYCYATCIMTLKYSIFYHLTPLIKTLLPALLLVEIVRRLIPIEPKPYQSDIV